MLETHAIRAAVSSPGLTRRYDAPRSARGCGGRSTPACALQCCCDARSLAVSATASVSDSHGASGTAWLTGCEACGRSASQTSQCLRAGRATQPVCVLAPCSRSLSLAPAPRKHPLPPLRAGLTYGRAVGRAGQWGLTSQALRGKGMAECNNRRPPMPVSRATSRSDHTV